MQFDNKPFQLSLLKLFATNSKFSEEHILSVESSYFDEKPLRMIFSIILNYYKKYAKEIYYNQLLSEIDSFVTKKGYGSDVQKLIEFEANEIFKTEVGSERFMKDNLVAFIQKKAMVNALKKSAKVVAEDGDYAVIHKEIENVLGAGSEGQAIYTFEDLFTVNEKEEKFYDPSKMIKFGLSTIDKALDGGGSSQELHVVIGPAKSGKSSFLLNLGAYNLYHGKTVLHISGEISSLEVLGKYSSRLTGLTKEVRRNEPDLFMEKLNKYKNIMKDNLFVTYFTEGSANFLDIRSWCSRVKSKYDKKPDVIIIDYDDCMVQGTEITLLNGKTVKIEDLVGLDEFWLYSSKEDGEIVPGRGHSARKVRDVDTLCHVTLDNGEVVKCTPDHKFMMRDGSFQEAQVLQPDDSLMPLYLRESKGGYIEHKDNRKDSYKSTYRMSAEVNTVEKGVATVKAEETNDRVVVHHKDHNKKNNDPSNLTWMTNIDHLRHHHGDPVRRKIIGEKNKVNTTNYFKDPENRKKQSENTTNYFKDPENRKKHGDSQKAKWNDDLRQKHSDNAKENINLVKVRVCKECGFSKETTQKEFHSHLLSHQKDKTTSCKYCKAEISGTGPERANHVRDCAAKVVKTLKCKYCGVDITGTTHVRAEHSRECARKVVKNRKCPRCKNMFFVDKSGLTEHSKECEKTHVKSKTCKHRNKCRPPHNHKVVSVEIIKLDKPEPVYDISVDKYHNFALSAGVFVHNCFLPNEGLSGDMYEDGGRRYTDMKALADYFQCPVFTAAQTSRNAYQKVEDGELITETDLAHSLKKTMKVTTVSSLNFKKGENHGTFYLSISRRGVGDIKVPIARDLSRSLFKEMASLPSEDEDEDED